MQIYDHKQETSVERLISIIYIRIFCFFSNVERFFEMYAYQQTFEIFTTKLAFNIKRIKFRNFNIKNTQNHDKKNQQKHVIVALKKVNPLQRMMLVKQLQS